MALFNDDTENVVDDKTEGVDTKESVKTETPEVIEETKNIPVEKEVVIDKELEKNYNEYVSKNDKRIEELENKITNLSKTLDRVSQKEVDEVKVEKPRWQDKVLGKK